MLRLAIFLNRSWIILLNSVHTGNLQFLAIFYNLAANEHGFCPKLVKHQSIHLNNQGSS